MTSIYRQLGIGCQWLFSALLQDTLGLSASQSTWTYDVPASEDTVRTLSLDARIELDHVKDVIARRRVEDWLAKVKVSLRLPVESADRIKGAVFEVRQGYKSKTLSVRTLILPMLRTPLPIFTCQFCSCSPRRLMAMWQLVIEKPDGFSWPAHYQARPRIVRTSFAERCWTTTLRASLSASHHG